MKKTLFALVVSSLICTPAFAQTYFVDGEASGAKWYASKVTGKHDGRIDVISGIIEFTEGRFISGEAIVDMQSIVVDDIQDPATNEKLVNHLNSEDFFDSSNYPLATIKVTEATPLEDDLYDVTADITIKDITHPVNFKATVTESDETIQATAHITLDRTLYEVRYGSGKFFENLGDRMIHDEFNLEISVTAYK